MRIGIIGGGPAGPYFALLMKGRDARHEIHVLEQNPPDATYGAMPLSWSRSAFPCAPKPCSSE